MAVCPLPLLGLESVEGQRDGKFLVHSLLTPTSPLDLCPAFRTGGGGAAVYLRVSDVVAAGEGGLEAGL